MFRQCKAHLGLGRKYTTVAAAVCEIAGRALCGVVLFTCLYLRAHIQTGWIRSPVRLSCSAHLHGSKSHCHLFLNKHVMFCVVRGLTCREAWIWKPYTRPLSATQKQTFNKAFTTTENRDKRDSGCPETGTENGDHPSQ